MTPLQQLSVRTTESLIREFFQHSEGHWRSDRRYYTLPNGKTQEIVSIITSRFLEAGSPELLKLAQLHELENPETIWCGAEVTWDSTNVATGKQQSAGSTIFGAAGEILYRDRGYAIETPVSAKFHLPNPETLCLRTEYSGSVFEEEIKHVGTQYRTRQTIVSRAGEQIMVGQYLEKRMA